MKVKLIYFKASGKYYSEGEYETQHKHMWKIFAEVRQMHRDGKLPGLTAGGEFGWYHALIEVPDHEHNHPQLILSLAREEYS